MSTTSEQTNSEALGNMDARRVLREVKKSTHRELLKRIDLELIDQLGPEEVKVQIANITRKLMDENNARLNSSERDEVTRQIQNEVLGLGPIEPLLADPTISDILESTPKILWQHTAFCPI